MLGFYVVPLLLIHHLRRVSSASAVVGIPSPALVSTGLKNLGNTCYMNAQLQCAFHIPAVRQRVFWSPSSEEDDAMEVDDDDADDNGSTAPSPTKNAPVAESEALLALRQVFEDMVRSATKKSMPVAPTSLCVRLGIPLMEQQDSQEFWKLLLPALEIESVSDLYKGSFEDYITALDGSERERRREELFLDLSLDVASSFSVLESLNKTFGEPELLSAADGNGWRPEKGADKVDALKGSRLLAKGLPTILQLHLKRFNYDWQTGVTSKLNNRFSFPEVLDLSSLCASNHEMRNDRTVFDLQSIVVHVGEYGVGHYYSYVRPDIRSDIWYRFNDDNVDRVNFQDVLEDSYGGRSFTTKNSAPKGNFLARIRRALQGGGGGSYGWGGSTSNAYVVQYVRRCDIPTLYPNEDC